MIDVLLFSIAGKKSNNTITALVEDLYNFEYTPDSDKKLLYHTLKVASNGGYPTASYYSTFFGKPSFVYSSIAEILTYTTKIKDFYRKQALTKGIVTALNDSTTSSQLIEKLSSLAQKGDLTCDDEFLDDFNPITYSQTMEKPHVSGYPLGVPEVDSLTNGCQPGTVGSIAAFVGEGKTTLLNSFLFKNALSGHKCVLFSLELAPELVWMSFQARYLYEVKGVQITAQDLIFKRLSDENEALIKKYDDDFKRDICSNLMIVDESVLSKKVVADAKMLSNLFKKIEQRLGSIDITAWDHVGQLELMYPDTGNRAIRNITSFTKTYINAKGVHPFSMLAVQANREGRARAARRNGVYDLRAISDLNECERSSTYCIFLYTTDDSKIVQETKITMLKHRLGAVLPEPATITFNPAIITVGTNVEKITASADDFSNVFGDSFDDTF